MRQQEEAGRSKSSKETPHPSFFQVHSTSCTFLLRCILYVLQITHCSNVLNFTQQQETAMKLVLGIVATISLIFNGSITTGFVQPSLSSGRHRRRQATFLKSSDRDISSLGDWAAKNQISISPSTSITLDSGDNYGITLNKSTKQYETILSIPKELVLDSESIRKEWYEDLKPALDYIENSGLDESTLNFVLIVKIIYEHNRKEESTWYEWIESLPRVFDTGVCMDEVELDCLPPFALALANFEIQQLEIFQRAYEMLKGTPIYVDGTTDESFNWAFNVILTRCWRYAQDNDDDDLVRPIAVPFGDMFNHKEPPNVMVQDADSLDAVEFVLCEDMDVPEGEERGLFLSYGLTNPHRFLTVFGFCDETMPEVFSQLLFSKPTPELVNLGCEDRSKIVYRTADGGVSTAVWDCILYTLLAQVPQEQKDFYAAHLEENFEKKAEYHRKYALEEALTLRNHVDETAMEFKDLVTKIDAMDEVERSTHPRLDMIRRHNHFLYRTFDKVRQRIDQRAQTETIKRRNS